MISRHQNSADLAEDGGMTPLEEIRAIVADCAANHRLDTSAVAFAVGVEPSTIYRWLRGGTPVGVQPLTLLRLFHALLKTAPDLANAARVDCAEDWQRLMADTRPVHRSIYPPPGAVRSILDGADVSDKARKSKGYV
jgi:hypothetical protein